RDNRNIPAFLFKIKNILRKGGTEDMKRMKKLAALFLVICMAVSAIGCGPSKSSQGSGNSDYRVAMITDSGDITDQSFNQTTYEACLEYCTENNIDFTYKKPDGDTDYARIAMIDVAEIGRASCRERVEM